MKKKEIYYLLVLVCCMVAVSGCAGAISLPPSGAFSPVINDVTYPSQNLSVTKYNFSRDEFEILGPVKAVSYSTSFLGIFASGDSGYGSAMEEARRQYGKVDGLIDVVVDTRLFKVLSLYVREETTISGNAVRHKK